MGFVAVLAEVACGVVVDGFMIAIGVVVLGGGGVVDVAELVVVTFSGLHSAHRRI